MKSVYGRQFAMMAGVILLAFALLGGAFTALSYQYTIEDKKDSMERNADYIASFTSTFLSSGISSSIQEPAYQIYISSLARISGSTVILAQNSGEIVFAASAGSGNVGSLLSGYIPSDILEEITGQGRFAGLSSLGGLLSDRCYVAASPILQNSYITGLTFQQGVVLVASDTSSLTRMWKDFSSIFILSAAVVFLLAAMASSVTSLRQTKPLKDMADAVRKFGRGEFDARVEGCEDRKDEVGELAEAFNVMADSLAKSEAQRSEFIANVSHELKTPMTTIAGFADGILDGTIPREKEAEALKTISSETRRLSRLVRRMLDLSKLQSSENVTAQERFDVAEVLIRVLVSLEGKINGRGLDVETALPEGPVMVWGDPDAITQVCYNLLDNAIKFAAPGTALGLGIQVKGEKAYVSVRDRGETIPPDELNQVFDRFHKTDRSRSEDREGVGLGLYIVKTIINNHKENITVTSENGVTEFTFTLTIA
ncbi:HAMP domain-containing sensor histidine kinase [Pseudoflavonifractor phocaeensis]|uniref:HAMP domain-containing sensor histidine kinase n=1 Tax=Pseudoflavonifractor phocaeensis TaxID=1870988 RepID=UPI00313BD42B